MRRDMSEIVVARAVASVVNRITPVVRVSGSFDFINNEYLVAVDGYQFTVPNPPPADLLNAVVLPVLCPYGC